MKLDLTLAIVKSLKVGEKPVGKDEKGRLIYEPNPRKTPYFIWDSSPSAPEGFGLKVANKKTFVVQRKVAGVSMRSSLGSISEFLGEGGLDEARKKAASLATEMVEKGVNPTVVARRQLANEITLGQAFDEYETFITTRENKKATANTLHTFKKVKKSFSDWYHRRISQIVFEEILDRFDDGKEFMTANEQRFRTAYTVVQHVIEVEALRAANEKRSPLLTSNPFSILKLKGKYRSNAEIERSRRENRVRNPLSPSDTLGKFLDALWVKRKATDERNKIGCSYLLLTLISGARRSECAKLKWAELLSEDEKLTNSWVDLKNEKIFFYKTKNSQDHLLPLPPMMKRMLEGLQNDAVEYFANGKISDKKRFYVFPARNKFSKEGHYSDSKDLLERIRDMAGIECLTRHDLRRSFGTILTDLEVPDKIGRRFMNHNQAETHNLYTTAEWKYMSDWMIRIEEAILSKSPIIYNALKPIEKSVLPITRELPVVPPDKPRTGRPKKEVEEATA